MTSCTQITITTTDEDVGNRLDKVIAAHVHHVSRVKIQQAIKAGGANVNGQIITEPKHSVQGGEEIILSTIDEPSSSHTLVPYKFDLSIVYEDEDLLVVNKPAGLTVHPGAGNKDKTLANALFEMYGHQLSDVSGAFRLGIVHRLDKDTSGLMVVAKHNQAHLMLAEQLEARTLKREYLALIYGVFTPTCGTIQANIGRSKSDRTKMAVLRHGGKHSVTHYKVLQTFGDSTISLVQCKLDTGRTHQIRLHFSFKKHPIVGDKTYLDSRVFNLNSLGPDAKLAVKALARQALHACALEFTHPISSKEMSFKSELPEDLENVLSALKKS
jgi:23S rRNA pseudouridine1911/1915/1917 synthase